jgi:hypothetical protein
VRRLPSRGARPDGRPPAGQQANEEQNRHGEARRRSIEQKQPEIVVRHPGEGAVRRIDDHEAEKAQRQPTQQGFARRLVATPRHCGTTGNIIPDRPPALSRVDPDQVLLVNVLQPCIARLRPTIVLRDFRGRRATSGRRARRICVSGLQQTFCSSPGTEPWTPQGTSALDTVETPGLNERFSNSIYFEPGDRWTYFQRSFHCGVRRVPETLDAAQREHNFSLHCGRPEKHFGRSLWN